MDQDQNHRNHKGMVDYINDLSNLRRGISLLRGAYTMIGPTMAIGGGITALLILVFVIGALLFLGGGGLAAEVGTNPAKNTQNINGIFNITGATQTEIQTVTNALSLGLAYPGYKKYFTVSDPLNIVFEKNLTWPLGSTNSVNGVTLEGNKITIRSGLPQDTLKYTILHETGHIIIFRGRAYQRYSLSDLRRTDTGCYNYLGFLKTYPFANTGGGGGAPVESFAESVSQFLLPRPPLGNFFMQCPNTYNWMLKNVFQ